MNHPARKPQRAGGALLALSVLIGVVVGALMREASLGFLVGIAFGLLLIVLVWWLDKRRSN
jgi:hypothetical protein